MQNHYFYSILMAQINLLHLKSVMTLYCNYDCVNIFTCDFVAKKLDLSSELLLAGGLVIGILVGGRVLVRVFLLCFL